jgi:CRISPR-associated endonuclease Csn1
MSNILGLDLGTNSIGWAIVNDYKKNILLSGVRIFPEGVNRDTKGKEKSKNETRRLARQSRKIITRKKIRKVKLLKELIILGLFPILDDIENEQKRNHIIESLVDYYSTDKHFLTFNDIRRKCWFSEKSSNLNFQVGVCMACLDGGLTEKEEKSTNIVFRLIGLYKDFFMLNPYEYRANGINSKLDKFQLGRVLYHFAQRKGFQSNRKVDENDKIESESDKEILDDKKTTKKTVTLSINDLKKKMIDSNCNYYGEYFYKTILEGKKIRGENYTDRKEFKKEFEAIWKNQTNYYNFLTNELKEKIDKQIIFYQRPMKSQKHLIGLCKLETREIFNEKRKKLQKVGKSKCPISTLSFERFRMFQEINNMSIVEPTKSNKERRPFTDEERKVIVDLYNTTKKFTLKTITDKLGLSAGHRILGRTSKDELAGDGAYAILKECFSDKWNKLGKKQNNIWWELYFAETSNDSEPKIKSKKISAEKKITKQHWSIDIFLEKNNLQVSTDLKEKLIRAFPCKGKPEFVGNLTYIMLNDLFGKDKWVNFPEKKKGNDKGNKEITKDDAWHTLFFADNKDWLKEYAEKKWKLNNNQIEKLDKIKFQQGYSALSRNAIDKINVFLEKGYIYTYAVFLANLKAVFKDYLIKKYNLNANDKQFENILEEKWQKSKEKIEVENRINYILLNEYPFERKKNNLINSFIADFKEHNSNVFAYNKDFDKEFEKRGKKIFGNDWEDISEQDIRIIKDIIEDNYLIIKEVKKIDYEKTKSIDERIIDFLKNNYQLNDLDISKLYHPSDIDIYPESRLFLDGNNKIKLLDNPDTNSLRNPVVMQVLYELKNLVNNIISDTAQSGYKIDKVRIELNRELNNKNQRVAIRQWQNKRQKENNNFRTELVDEYEKETNIHLSVSEDDIIKYRLRNEMIKLGILNCPYCENPPNIMGLGNIYGANQQFQIEHIFPRSISCDDSQENLILAHIQCNAMKSNRIPYELDNHKDILTQIDAYRKKATELLKQIISLKAKAKLASTPDKKNEIIQKRILLEFDYKYYSKKYYRFTATEIPEGFRNRQLRDTSYITKIAVSYLKSVFETVEAVSKDAVAQFRKEWNLQGDEKDRTLHSHHAIDAIIVACMNKKIYDEMAQMMRDNDRNFNKFKTPWNSFYKDVKSTVSEILVSFKKINRLKTEWIIKDKKDNIIERRISVRGQLHDLKFFGKKIIEGKETYVQRKKLSELTFPMIDKIADKQIRGLIMEKINNKSGQSFFNVTKKLNKDEKKVFNIAEEFKTIMKHLTKEQKKEIEETKKTILKEVFAEKIILKNGNHCIKSVRIKQELTEPIQLYNKMKFTKSNNNYAFLIIKENEELKEIPITFFDAIKKNIKLNNHLVNVVTYLQINDMFLLGLSDKEFEDNKSNFNFLSQYLYRVEALSSKYYEFRHHLEATHEREERPYYVRIQSFGIGITGWLKWNPIKVKVDILGKNLTRIK